MLVGCNSVFVTESSLHQGSETESNAISMYVLYMWQDFSLLLNGHIVFHASLDTTEWRKAEWESDSIRDF